MKTIITTIILGTLSFSSSALAFNTKEVVGKYLITSKDIPVQNMVTLSANQKMKLVEHTFEGSIECMGTWSINDNIINGLVRCPDGENYQETINLNGVKNLKNFEAKVFSSLYNQEMMMSFKRIK